MSVGLVASAQQQEPFATRGLFSASASIGPGFMVDHPLTNIYITGDADFFLEDHISLHGSASWFVGAQQDSTFLKENSRLSFGPVYHWMKGGLDLGLGFMPGVSLTQLEPAGEDGPAAPLKLLPNISLSGSATYYVWKYMHFFANVRYVHAQYAAAPMEPLSLDEFVVTAGLGWQFRMWKKS
ncbi:MAG: hypothetical protein WAU70_06050 [Flavobacteriales bacterium]